MYTEEKNGDPQKMKMDIRTIRNLCSYQNIYYTDDINFEDLNLPQIKGLEFDTPDLTIAKRLVDSYCSAMGSGGDRGDGIWEAISEYQHKALI